MSAVERPTDGPDTELAAAEAWFRANDDATVGELIHWSPLAKVHTVTILRAFLARPAAGRDLTAQDVREVICETHEYERIADRLNAIARPVRSDAEEQ